MSGERSIYHCAESFRWRKKISAEPMRCFEFDLNHLLQIEAFNKEHLIPPRKHVSRKLQTYILYYITKGGMHMLLDGQEIFLTEGDLCLFAPEQTQAPLCAEDCAYFYVHFHSPAILQQELSQQTYIDKIHSTREQYTMSDSRGYGRFAYLKTHIMQKTHLADKDMRYYLMEQFEKCCIRFGETNVEKRLRSAWGLAEILLRVEQFSAEQLLLVDGGGKAYKTVNALRQYLEQHFQEEITGADIQEKFMLQYDYVNRLFRQATGDSIIRYRNKRRLEAAKFLLSFALL